MHRPFILFLAMLIIQPLAMYFFLKVLEEEFFISAALAVVITIGCYLVINRSVSRRYRG